jgi:pyridoxamine 5'-phosphate oxidase family protein
MFSEKELAYLKSPPLARIATASSDGQPDVAPVGFEFDGTYFYIGGLDIKRTLKYKNTLSNPRATLVVDDLESTDPWMPRGIKVRGFTEIVERQGRFGVRPYIRIKPEIKWSWGMDEPAIVNGQANIKRVKL